jgi:hypothetical protein
MDQKVIYLCGSQDGDPREAWPVFDEAESVVREMFPGAQIWNPVRVEAAGFRTVRKHLGLSLPFLLDRADLLVRLPGWSTNIVARAEHTLAVALDIDVVSLRWKNNSGDKWYRIMELAPADWDERDQ